MSREILGYLDHNILDSIRKGDPFQIKTLIKKFNITPVYSYENLREIKRSVGSENQFLNILSALEAKYIEPIFEKNIHTGDALIHVVDVFKQWDWFIENDDPIPEYGYGLTSMLEKFYGGRGEETYSEIFENGNSELQSLFTKALEEIGDNEALTEEIAKVINDLPRLINQQNKQMAIELDKQTESPIAQFEKVTGVGAIVLNNIEPPCVVKKIFDMIKDSMPNAELDIDTFFGVKHQPYESGSDREKTLLEKVNGIYHQLNFLGYFRDSKMKNTRGFIRSTSDMTHAGTASFCDLLLCRDKGLVKKAAAAYEYLNVKTQILFFQNNSPKN